LTKKQFNALLDHPSFRSIIEKTTSKINRMSSSQNVKSIRSAILTMALRNLKYFYVFCFYINL
jgi:hypothetical protein